MCCMVVKVVGVIFWVGVVLLFLSYDDVDLRVVVGVLFVLRFCV